MVGFALEGTEISGSNLPKTASQTATQALLVEFLPQSLNRLGRENSPVFNSSPIPPSPPAAMPPALRPPAAPSQNLLRFLRAQSEGVGFFTGDPKCAAIISRNGRSNATFSAAPRSKPCARLLRTSEPRRETVIQAGLWPFDSILPKSPRKPRATTDSKTSFGAQRNSSSNQSHRERCRPKWRDWLFGRGTKGSMQLTDEDLRLQLEEESGSIFARRSLTAKAALDPRLRCTEVDGNGQVIMVDGELKKSELIAKVSDIVWLWCVRVADHRLSMDSSRAIFERLTRRTSLIFLFDRLLSC